MNTYRLRGMGMIYPTSVNSMFEGPGRKVLLYVTPDDMSRIGPQDKGMSQLGANPHLNVGIVYFPDNPERRIAALEDKADDVLRGHEATNGTLSRLLEYEAA